MFQNKGSNENTQHITAEYIEENMIPPTLNEVRKPMFESKLSQLKQDTAKPTKLDISDNEDFSYPTNQMSYEMNIKYCV